MSSGDPGEDTGGEDTAGETKGEATITEVETGVTGVKNRDIGVEARLSGWRAGDEGRFARGEPWGKVEGEAGGMIGQSEGETGAVSLKIVFNAANTFILLIRANKTKVIRANLWIVILI